MEICVTKSNEEEAGGILWWKSWWPGTGSNRRPSDFQSVSIGVQPKCSIIAGPNALIDILRSLVVHPKTQFVVEQPNLEPPQRGADEYQDKYQDSSAQG
jgi:hypothetical protein